MILSFTFIILLLITIESIKYECNKESDSERYYNRYYCVINCDSVYSRNSDLDTNIVQKQNR